MLPIQNLCCLFQTSNLLPKNRISTSDSEGFTQTSASAWCLPSDDIHRLDCEGHSIVCPSTNFLRIVFEFQSSVFHYLALVHIPSPKQINNHQNKNLFPWRMDIHGHCPNFAKTTAEDEDVANFRVWISNEPLVFQFLLLIADFRVSNRQLVMSRLVDSRLNIFPEIQHFPKLKLFYTFLRKKTISTRIWKELAEDRNRWLVFHYLCHKCVFILDNLKLWSHKSFQKSLLRIHFEIHELIRKNGLLPINAALMMSPSRRFLHLAPNILTISWVCFQNLVKWL